MIEEESGTVTFYDSGWKGRPLFTAPRDRSWADFITESKKHGWPSFRDSEVDWDYARVLPGGEMVSIDGTHLGHNLPDGKGNRYCISKYPAVDKELELARSIKFLYAPVRISRHTVSFPTPDLVSIAGSPTSNRELR